MRLTILLTRRCTFVVNYGRIGDSNRSFRPFGQCDLLLDPNIGREGPKKSSLRVYIDVSYIGMFLSFIMICIGLLILIKS